MPIKRRNDNPSPGGASITMVMNASSLLRNLVCALVLLVGAASAAPAQRVAAPSVLQCARGVHQELIKSGRLPDQVSMAAAAGGETTLTLGQAALVFAEALGGLTGAGRLPEAIEVAGDGAAGVTGASPGSPNAGAVVSVAALGQQCRALSEMSRRFGGLPLAVWVDGQRLTLAEFAGSVAAALSEFAERAQLPARIIIPQGTPPPAWVKGAAAGWRVTAVRPPGEGEDAGGSPSRSENAARPRPEPQPRPLTLSLADGATVSGGIVLRADLWPEPRMLALFVDGKQRGLLNFRPYQFVIDTRTLNNGPHRIRVEAYGSASGVQTAEITVTVANE